MLQPPKVTVWSSIDELKSVQALLYEQQNNQDGRPRALAIIRAWATRGRLPHAIESTAQLTECFLNDTAGAPALLLQQAFAMAICRFVNGFIDPIQKGHFAMSMYQLAAIQGIPASFIDIRHAATHEALPPLGVLRTTCSRALDWLWEHYWELLDSSGTATPRINMKDLKMVQESHISRLQNLLSKWEVLKLGTRDSGKKRDERREDREEARICNDLVSLFKEVTESMPLSEILVHEHLLLMTEKSSMMAIYRSTDLWKPIILSLDTHIAEFTADLFTILLEAVQEESLEATNIPGDFVESEAEYTYQWLEFLVTLVIKQKIANESGSLLDDVLSQCIQSQNTWCFRLAEHAIGLSTALEARYSQVCTLAKKRFQSAQSQTVLDEAANPSISHSSEEMANSTMLDFDSELEGFEDKLKQMQVRREQWNSSNKSKLDSGSLDQAEAQDNGSSAGLSGKRVRKFFLYDGGWSAKQIGIV